MQNPSGVNGEPIQQKARRVGGLPSALVVGVTFILLLAALLLPQPARAIVAVAVFVIFAVCCWLRPTRRLEVFLTAVAPNAGGRLAHDLAGISEWAVALPLMLLVLLILASDDRDERTAEPATQP